MSAMSLKLTAHQLYYLGIVAPAEGCTMQRNKSFTAGDVIQYCFRLSVFNLVDIGKQYEPIKARQRFCCQVFHAVGVLQLDPASFQDRSQFMKPLRRPMMTIVAHEEQFQVGSV